ncbi:YciI family protein [Klenkia sp. PcliD-1-E]|uniref:YciI family protein n=1 Tax=Klenkia sp. PcliD-1-E TaxID=2954492 RepID=UPI002097C90F|nr:YciI family protein [Klenkia sp. PcliD-1-E]MCO7218631.1 YciI family protein [Klenkia sp. PcliD-1-E]
MTQYLLSVVTPSAGTGEHVQPTPEQLAPIMARVDQLRADMQSAGVWVFAGGLEAPSTATVLRPSGDEVLLVDGPFAEGKEYLGGFTVVDVPDLDAALEWGRRTVAAIGLPIEVRPFSW